MAEYKDNHVPLVGLNSMISGAPGTSLGNKLIISESFDKDIQISSSPRERLYNNSNRDNPLKFMFSLVTLCTKGEFRLKLNLETITLKSGQMLLSSPGVILSRVEMAPGTRGGYIAFDASSLNLLESNAIRSTRIIRNAIINPVTINLCDKHRSMAEGIFKAMDTALKSETFQFKEEAVSGLLICLGSLLAQLISESGEDSSDGNSRGDKLVRDFFTLLQQYCKQERSVKFYADQFCLSPKYFSKLIYDNSGKHVGEWIRDFVILEAKAMLRTGMYTVQQVSYALNFPNSSFFGKYFKSATGILPRKYIMEGD